MFIRKHVCWGADEVSHRITFRKLIFLCRWDIQEWVYWETELNWTGSPRTDFCIPLSTRWPFDRHFIAKNRPVSLCFSKVMNPNPPSQRNLRRKWEYFYLNVLQQFSTISTLVNEILNRPNWIATISILTIASRTWLCYTVSSPISTNIWT